MNTVKIEAEFNLVDMGKLVSAWAKLPFSKTILHAEKDNPINWAQCILDLMMANIDEEALGIEFSGSVCDANPEWEWAEGENPFIYPEEPVEV